MLCAGLIYVQYAAHGPTWPTVRSRLFRPRPARDLPRDPVLHRVLRHGVLQRPHDPAPLVDHGGRPALRPQRPARPRLRRRQRHDATMARQHVHGAPHPPALRLRPVLRLHSLHPPDGLHEPDDEAHVDPSPRTDRLPGRGLSLLSCGLRPRARRQAPPRAFAWST